MYAEAAAMKTVQNAVALLVVVGLVFGIAFFWQYLSGTTADPNKGGTPLPPVSSGAEMPLQFPETIVEWHPESAGQFELHTVGYHDFWFSNPHDVPVTVRIHLVNCKCAKVEACPLATDAAAQVRRWQIAAGLFPALQVHGGLLSVLPQLVVDDTVMRAALGVKLNWTLLDGTPNSYIRAEPKNAGVVRVYWEAKELGLKRVVAELETQAETGSSRALTRPRLEVPTQLVPPVDFDPKGPPIAVGDLGNRESREVSFWCWSPSRAAFNLSAQVLGRGRLPDPCFVCSIRPMTDAEREEVAASQRTRVVSGYRVAVVVHERVSDKQQLELGPFMRRVALTSDPDVDLSGPLLKGVVRGQVQVGTPEDDDKIDLKSFPSERGVMREVPVAVDPGAELLSEVIERDPDFLKAELIEKQKAREGSGSLWMLRVEVPPNTAFGSLPFQSAIYLTLRGNPPRRVRIPVSGNAYTK
jgi:hypothetical protein